MALSGLAKTATWLIRLLQLLFAIILTGIVSYMIHQFRKYNAPYLPSSSAGHVPDELIISIIASVLALLVTIFSLAAVCFLGATLELIAAGLDLLITALYIAAAALLRHNFNSDAARNPLRNALIWLRTSTGHSARVSRNTGLVRTLVALVVVQIILFAITTVLGAVVARRKRREEGSGRRKHVV